MSEHSGEHEIGGAIDCAPIASRPIEWVDQHDLGDLCGAHSGSTEQVQS